MQAPVKRYGGKHYLADWILSHAPRHYITYCEPFFGGGAVLLKHDGEGKSEVINDLDGELMNFWATLADPALFEQLQRALSVTPFSQMTFEDAEETAPLEMRVLRAQRFFIRARQSRQGMGTCFATMSKSRTRRGMNEQVAQWLGAIEGLPEVHARLQRVVVLNDDALEVIKRLDHPETWFYLDPPYLPETRFNIGAYGDHEMSFEQHCELLDLLADTKGRFTLSGYHSPLYDETAEAYGWRHEEKLIDNKASSKPVKPVMTEVIWMNY